MSYFPGPLDPITSNYPPKDHGRAVALIVIACAVGAAVLALAAIPVVKALRTPNNAALNISVSQSIQRESTSTTIRPTPTPGLTGGLPKFTAPANLGHCQYIPKGEPAKKLTEGRAQLPRSDRPVPIRPAKVRASMKTNQGDIGLVLDNGKAPCTVNSFASLAQGGYFDDTLCHRITSGELSVLQCGDPTGTGTGGPGYEFDNEYPTTQYPAGDPAAQQAVVYPAGTLAMANAGPGTNGSQFFMVYKDSLLPPQYTVFGTIDKTGMETLAKIATNGIRSGQRGTSDGAPAQEVKIIDVRLD